MALDASERKAIVKENDSWKVWYEVINILTKSQYVVTLRSEKCRKCAVQGYVMCQREYLKQRWQGKYLMKNQGRNRLMQC